MVYYFYIGLSNRYGYRERDFGLLPYFKSVNICISNDVKINRYVCG